MKRHWRALEYASHTVSRTRPLAHSQALDTLAHFRAEQIEKVVSMSEDSQDPSAGAAPAEVSENLAPASDDEVLRSVSGAEFSDPKGAPPPVSHPPAPQPTTPTLPTDAAIEIPQETTRALYVFNARVANRRDGVPTATCDVVVKSREGAETRVTSLAPGEKYLNPTATYGDEYVATCADTKQELARWIVEARRGYDVTRRSITGKEYLQRKWIDPEVQKVVLGEWTSWRRLLTPNALDYDMSHWDEPEDDPETGEVAHPFVQRFLYYLVARHQVLTCFFVGEGDAFSRRERLADLTDTVFWTWVITVAFLDLDSVSRVFIVAMFMTPISAVFQIASRIQCCGVEWGRVITIPLWSPVASRRSRWPR